MQVRERERLKFNSNYVNSGVYKLVYNNAVSVEMRGLLRLWTGLMKGERKLQLP
jgi:hypothetical protein